MALVVSNRQQPFLLAFDESLRKLNDINAAITKNTENKRKFTGDVLRKLQELHEKIKGIVIKITEIKDKIIQIQGQVSQNNNGIQEKERELADLKQQLAQLTSERNNLTTELDQVKNDANANTTRLQLEINSKEEELRNVMNKNSELETTIAALEQQINGIRADMQNSGDQQSRAHDDALQQLRTQYETQIQQLNDQIVDNQRQITENQNTITTNEARIRELTDQHGVKDTQTQDLVNNNSALETRNNELDNRNKDLEARLNAALTDYNNLQLKIQQLETQLEERNNEAGEFIKRCEQEKKDMETQIQENNRRISELEAVILERDNQIAVLQRTIDDATNSQQAKDVEIANLNNTIIQITNVKNTLEQERDDLKKRIEAATVVINNASNNLSELTNQQFYDKSMDDVNNQISEIEKTLGLINNEIQITLNQRGGPSPPLPPRSQSVDLNNLQLFGKNTSLSDLFTQLDNKANTSANRINKYSGAKSDINGYLNIAKTKNHSQDEIQNTIERLLNRRSVIEPSTGNIKGGYNKTKKLFKKYGKFTRKQKGGFLYGKYKTNSNKSKNAKNTTSTTSSLSSSSSYNTSKKNRKPKNKDLSKRNRL